MGAYHDFVFNEDLDTNAAAAQLAAAKGQRNCVLPDADTIQLPDDVGMYLKAIRAADETAGGLDGYLHFLGKGSERKFRFGALVEIGDHLTTEIIFEDNEFPLSPGQKIKAFANKSGSGAEQHTIILTIWVPSLPDVSSPQTGVKHMHMLGVMTGALTAQTISGLNSIIGDETALQDSEIQFAEDREYILKGFYGTPGGAGYGALGVRHPNGKIDRMVPASFTAIHVPPFIETNWAFSGKAPVRQIGCGVGTTSTELTVLLGELD